LTGLRFDRLATLYVADLWRQSVTAAPDRIPILMYHSISDDDGSGTHPYFCTTTTPAMFAQQMAHLHEQHYRTITPAEAAVRCAGNAHDSGKCVVITFDDGFFDFYGRAAPVLARYRFGATVYLPTAHIGDTRRSFKNRECLTWSEVDELCRSGFSFGSHTVSHPQLTELDRAGVADEVGRSKDTIEQRLGRAIDSFAYPFAFPAADAAFKRALREILDQAGYGNGVCTTIGRAGGRQHDAFFMKRLPINSGDDTRLFEAKLAGSYDWLAGPQSWFKRMKLKRAKRWAPSQASRLSSADSKAGHTYG